MANKVYNMAGGLHSAAAYSALEDSMYGSCVATTSDYVATAGTGMNVSLSTGTGLISTGLGYARRIASDAVQTITVTAASSAAPRIDSLVAYIDNAVSPVTTVVDNTNDILKFKMVPGAAASTPVAPPAAVIQSSVGAGNPYMVLWNIKVPKGATALSSATFTDKRVIANASIADGAVTTAKIADSAVTSDKIDWTTFGSSARATTLISSKSIGTSWANLVTVDLSGIAAGQKFLLIGSGWWRAGSGTSNITRVSYNSSNTEDMWCAMATDQTTTAFPTSLQIFTKVSGVNSAYFQIRTISSFTFGDGRMVLLAVPVPSA